MRKSRDRGRKSNAGSSAEISLFIGVPSEATAANLLVQLRSFLSEVRSSFGQAWESYQLLLPTNRSEWTGQHHEVVVNLLQGLNTPFLKETRKLSEPLKRNTLYLLDKGRDNAVELLPLVKISNAPKADPFKSRGSGS